MSNGNEKKAAYYRQRAAQLRAIAASMKEDHHRETLLEVACDYDDLAEMRERVARDDPPEEPQSEGGVLLHA